MSQNLNKTVLKHAVQSARGQFGAGDITPDHVELLVRQAVPAEASDRIVHMYMLGAAGVHNSTSRFCEHFA